MEMHSDLFKSSGYEIDSKVVGLRINSAMPAVVRIHVIATEINYDFFSL